PAIGKRLRAGEPVLSGSFANFRFLSQEARMKTSGSRALFVLALAACLCPPAPAAVFQCGAGDVACLIGAIHAANADSAADTIQLAAGTYTLTAPDNTTDAPNGLPEVTSTISIVGPGAGVTTIQRDPALSSPSTNPFRILHVTASGNLRLEAVTIANGGLD